MIKARSPSECVEAPTGGRYMSQASSPLPGPYSFKRTPFLREIIDCFDINSPIREVAVMKGAQLGLTTLLENIIFYCMVEVKTAPVMLLTADDALAKIRLDSYIMPMIADSGLGHLIKSQDELNSRKTGMTAQKLSWYGGGSLLPTGAVNPNKSRSFSIRYLLRDEIDAYKQSVGDDGDPLAISYKRTIAYKESRKVFDISTPLIRGRSHIHSRFLLGDQRYYFVRCLGCGFPQVMRWKVDLPNGKRAGVVWETENDRLVPGSVRWLCENCLRPHTNDDKIRLLDPAHGAEWRPTARPHSPDMRSYHIAGIYSPVGMNTFEAMVLEWLEAWDEPNNRARNHGKVQAFYNTILGDPWEAVGYQLKYEQVSAHRRQAYHYGEVPNKWAIEHAGGSILFLVCTVDVHAANLAVAVWGWTRDRRVFLIEYERLEGDTSRFNDPGTWGELRSRLHQRQYMADDGYTYRIATCVIDSGYKPTEAGDEQPGASVVLEFCDSFQEGGVFPLRGRKTAVKGGFQEFSKFVTESGGVGFHVTVDYYKDRWYSALKQEWDGLGLQPETFFNAPVDVDDRQLKELTAETKELPKDSKDGVLQWRRRGENALWDLLVYANFAHDLIAHTYQVTQLGRKVVDLEEFWETCEQQDLFRFPVSNNG